MFKNLEQVTNTGTIIFIVKYKPYYSDLSNLISYAKFRKSPEKEKSKSRTQTYQAMSDLSDRSSTEDEVMFPSHRYKTKNGTIISNRPISTPVCIRKLAFEEKYDQSPTLSRHNMNNGSPRLQPMVPTNQPRNMANSGFPISVEHIPLNHEPANITIAPKATPEGASKE